MASNAAASGTGYYAGHAPRVDAVHVPIAAPKCATVEDLVALSARRSEGGAAACEGDAAANAAAARPVLKSSEWNALSGSWHWEERDETAWLLSTLQSRLLALAPAEGRNGASARVTSVEMEDGGHAEVCVRKAKKIVTFELALTIAWAGECESGRGVMRVSGKQRLADVVEDDGGGSDSAHVGVLRNARALRRRRRARRGSARRGGRRLRARRRSGGARAAPLLALPLVPREPPSLSQHLPHREVRGLRHIVRRFAFLRTYERIRTCVEELLHHIAVTALRRELERSGALLSTLRVYPLRSARRQQRRHHRAVALPRGERERRDAVHRLGVHVRTRSDEQLHEARVPHPRRYVQRCPPQLVRRVHRRRRQHRLRVAAVAAPRSRKHD